RRLRYQACCCRLANSSGRSLANGAAQDRGLQAQGAVVGGPVEGDSAGNAVSGGEARFVRPVQKPNPAKILTDRVDSVVSLSHCKKIEDLGPKARHPAPNLTTMR